MLSVLTLMTGHKLIIPGDTELGKHYLLRFIDVCFNVKCLKAYAGPARPFL